MLSDDCCKVYVAASATVDHPRLIEDSVIELVVGVAGVGNKVIPDILVDSIPLIEPFTPITLK